MTGERTEKRAQGPITAVLFDKDGTLFDFAATWRGVAHHVLARLAPDDATLGRMAEAVGLDLATGSFRPGSPIVAGALAEIAEILAPMAGLEPRDIERIANDAALDAEAMAALTPAVPDLPGLFAELRAMGLTLGVATHDSEEAARAQLGATGALDALAFLAGYDSGHGLKPGPGMLEAFCRATGIPAAEIAVVGDSLHDLDMARAGGAALAIAVLSGPATRADLAPAADVVIETIGALPDLLSVRNGAANATPGAAG